MSTSRKHIKTDATNESDLGANAVPLFQSIETMTNGAENDILSSEESVCDAGMMHVDDQRFLLTGGPLHSKRRSSGTLRKHVVAQISKKWRSR